MSCKSIVCCDRNDYDYIPGELPPPAPQATTDDGTCICPSTQTPRVNCLLMKVVGQAEFHQVCLVEDAGIFTLEINQSPE